MEELGKMEENRKLYNDIKSFIHIENKSTFHSMTKHIQLSYHFTLSVLEYGQLKPEKIHTGHNLANILTKEVTREKQSSCLASFGLQA